MSILRTMFRSSVPIIRDFVSARLVVNNITSLSQFKVKPFRTFDLVFLFIKHFFFINSNDDIMFFSSYQLHNKRINCSVNLKIQNKP